MFEEPARPVSWIRVSGRYSRAEALKRTTHVDQGGSPDVVGNTLERELEGMAEETRVTTVGIASREDQEYRGTHVKSPVASACFTCSSVRNLVSVTMSVLTFSAESG